MNNLSEKFLSIKEFAIRAGVSPNSIYSMIDRKELRCVRKLRGKTMQKLVPESELKKFEIKE